jgi:hypothetical protein
VIQFGRIVTAQLGTEGDTGRSLSSPMRIKFDVLMNDGSTPNSAKISITNPAPDTISLAQQEGAVVRLLVGYSSGGGVERLIFHGEPIPDGIEERRESTDRVLSVEAQDGRTAYTGTFMDVSYASEQTARQVFQVVADELGLPIGAYDIGDDERFPYGRALSGTARSILDDLCGMVGRQWTIRDGTLQIWETGTTTGEDAILFTPTTGLVGSPTKTDTGVEIKALIDPSMRPGRAFRVESEAISGDYRCTECRFRGDSRGSEFYVEVVGVTL